MNSRVKIALLGLCAPAAVLALTPTPRPLPAAAGPTAEDIERAETLAQAQSGESRTACR